MKAREGLGSSGPLTSTTVQNIIRPSRATEWKWAERSRALLWPIRNTVGPLKVAGPPARRLAMHAGSGTTKWRYQHAAHLKQLNTNFIPRWCHICHESDGAASHNKGRSVNHYTRNVMFQSIFLFNYPSNRRLVWHYYKIYTSNLADGKKWYRITENTCLYWWHQRFQVYYSFSPAFLNFVIQIMKWIIKMHLLNHVASR